MELQIIIINTKYVYNQYKFSSKILVSSSRHQGTHISYTYTQPSEFHQSQVTSTIHTIHHYHDDLSPSINASKTTPKMCTTLLHAFPWSTNFVCKSAKQSHYVYNYHTFRIG
jgi:hypothetical protein